MIHVETTLKYCQHINFHRSVSFFFQKPRVHTTCNLHVHAAKYTEKIPGLSKT